MEYYLLKKYEAEYFWFRQAQVDTYERAQLTAGHNLEKSSSIGELHPFIDEKGILRIRTRLDNADLTCCETAPVLLPNNHPVTHLIVMRAHKTVLHGGVGATLAEIHARFWVVESQTSRETCDWKVFDMCAISSEGDKCTSGPSSK